MKGWELLFGRICGELIAESLTTVTNKCLSLEVGLWKESRETVTTNSFVQNLSFLLFSVSFGGHVASLKLRK
jgi:hypothetical protein